MTQAALELKHILDEMARDLNITTDVLAGALAAHPRTVQRWREENTVPQKEGRKRLQDLIAVRDHLYATFTSPEAVHAWMHTNNRYLGGLTPAEVARTGRLDRIEAALEALDSGIFI